MVDKQRLEGVDGGGMARLERDRGRVMVDSHTYPEGKTHEQDIRYRD